MRIAFVHDWPVEWEQEYSWRDGLAAALRELGKRHELKVLVCAEEDIVIPHPYFPITATVDILGKVLQFTPDVILMWGDCTRPNAEPLSQLKKPMALCFAGGNPFGKTNKYFQHFFVESSVYLNRFHASGNSASLAFGTNTELFQPVEATKYFDAIFPATFADWKRHKIFAEATKGLNALAVGYMYMNHEQHCWQECQRAGNLVLPHVSHETLKRLYAASKTCVITSNSQGGSQRTVLEAMAMNIPVIVMEDSDKTTEYVREGGGVVVKPNPLAIKQAIHRDMGKDWNTRDYILNKWSEFNYADNLEKVLINLHV